MYYHATHVDNIPEMLAEGIRPTDGRTLGTRGVFATRTYGAAQKWSTYFAHATTSYSQPIDRKWVIVSLTAPAGATILTDTNENAQTELDRLLEPDAGVLIEVTTAIPVADVVGMTRAAWEQLQDSHQDRFTESDEFRIHSERH